MASMRNRWIVAIASAAMVITACGSSNSNQTATNTSPIELGAWMPLTGPIAVHGLAQRAGGDAYFKFLNDHGGVHGRKVDWVVEDGYKEIAFVHSDPSAFVNIAKAGTEAIKAANPSANVHDISVKFNTTDYAPVVLQVKNLHPDAVILILSTAEVVAYLKQASQQGLKTGVYTYAPNSSADVIRLAGADADGLKSEAFTLPPDDTSAAGVKDFVNAMQKYEAGTPADYESEMTWALCKVAVAAISKINGKIDKDSIVKALQSMSNYDSGVMPPITFSASQHLGASKIQRVQLTGGKWTLVGSYVGADSNL